MLMGYLLFFPSIIVSAEDTLKNWRSLTLNAISSNRAAVRWIISVETVKSWTDYMSFLL